jgi:hypothetical protein
MFVFLGGYRLPLADFGFSYFISFYLLALYPFLFAYHTFIQTIYLIPLLRFVAVVELALEQPTLEGQ